MKKKDDGLTILNNLTEDQLREIIRDEIKKELSKPPILKVKRLDKSLPLPKYQTDGSVGLDLCLRESFVVIRPGHRYLAKTGIVLEIPPGYEGQIRPRSGLAAKFGLTVLNSPGTIDQDFRGEIEVLLINKNQNGQDIILYKGNRIAQLVISPVAKVEIQEIEDTSVTSRGANGFGSTGV